MKKQITAAELNSNTKNILVLIVTRQVIFFEDMQLLRPVPEITLLQNLENSSNGNLCTRILKFIEIIRFPDVSKFISQLLTILYIYKYVLKIYL